MQKSKLILLSGNQPSNIPINIQMPKTIDAGLWEMFFTTLSVIPTGILAAIEYAISIDSVFLDKFPGGCWFGQAPEESITPYVVFRDVTSVPYWMTGPGYYEVEAISACIWTRDNDGLKPLGLYLESWLHRRAMERQDGMTTTLQRTRSRQAMEPARSKDNEILYYYCVDYDAFTSKTM